jgi:DNA gyrase subunit B
MRRSRPGRFGSSSVFDLPAGWALGFSGSGFLLAGADSLVAGGSAFFGSSFLGCGFSGLNYYIFVMNAQKKNEGPSSSYSAENIQVLEGLAAVRKRPGMYIGTTDIAGLHHLVWEIVDNAIDESMAGFCKNIEVVIHEDGSVSVEDDGRGIPVDKHSKTGKSALETVLTVLHAGGKFGDGGGYKVSGGLHGVGSSVVNALSTKLVATVYREGKEHQQTYKKGDPQGDVEVIGKTDKQGTKIHFWPDPTIFESIVFDFTTVLNRLRQQAYLTKGVKIQVSDLREDDKRYQFYFEGGIKSYVQHLNKNKETKTTF